MTNYKQNYEERRNFYELKQIPEGYDTPSNNPGILEELTYGTYESRTYEQKSQPIQKRDIVYRPGAQTACEDLARAIRFIFEHAEELEVDTDCYSLWGGSAGGRMD